MTSLCCPSSKGSDAEVLLNMQMQVLTLCPDGLDKALTRWVAVSEPPAQASIRPVLCRVVRGQ